MDISKSLLKKNLKKIEKLKHRLTEKNRIIFSDEPTEIILVANAGLANDVKRHELELHLSTYEQHIINIITPPKLTFSIVICKDIVSSAEIVANLQCFTILTPDLKIRPSVHAFCLFVSQLPENFSTEIINISSAGPPGLVIINDFINVEEEKQLIDHFISMKSPEQNGELRQRTVIHFGYEFNYENNLVDTSQPLHDRPIPKSCSDLLARLEERTGTKYSVFNQLTVNIYEPGDGIPAHTDTHSIFGAEIVSISLHSDIMMQWTNPDSVDGDVRHTDLRARSACIMAGEARLLWRHSIPARKSDLTYDPITKHFERRQRSIRISLTFRQIKQQPGCQCPYGSASCDVKQKAPAPQFCPDHPVELEQRFVHNVYDNIASHFSSTRHSMWPRVRTFIESQPKGGVAADLGCGNGKYFPAILNHGSGLLATDSSIQLCRIASRPSADVVQSSLLQLPFRVHCCDYWICIAVLHHLSTPDRRRDALTAMVRLLRVGGRGLVYVWAREQKQDGIPSKYVDGNRSASTSKSNTQQNGTPLPVHQNRTQFSGTDMLVPWCKKASGPGPAQEQVFTRYYHLFEQGELEELCISVDGVRVADSWHDSGNWAVVIEKM